MSEDNDENIIIVCLSPQDRLLSAQGGTKRKQTQARQCYLCETEWPDNLDWPPPKRKVNNGVIIYVENEPDGTDSKVSNRTCYKKRCVVTESSSTLD